MEAPTQVTIGAEHTHNYKESIEYPTQVTIGATHTQNSMDTDTKEHCEEENGGEKDDDYGDDAISLPGNLGLSCVIRNVEASISSLSGNNEYPPPPNPPSREIKLNGKALQSKKMEM